MRQLLISLIILTTAAALYSQPRNIRFTDPLVDEIIKGDYNPADFIPAEIISDPESVVEHLLDGVSATRLKEYLIDMQQFRTRNTGSDTTITGSGIGAAREWALRTFESFNADNGGRLITSFMEFDQSVCSMSSHKNIVAVLPGVGEGNQEMVLIEGHFDSRCGTNCDIDCLAQGMEDNASGSGLVLELARVMSQLTFDKTIMFMLTIGEEQGLIGANALAFYCLSNSIDVHSVFNNDIVGGVICGSTASPPGCPGLNEVDSINVRLYSSGTFNSSNKGLARFTKLEYQENLRDLMPVQPIINIMSAEDRIGRGGDHIPFRMFGFPAIRFTSANEHGDAGIHPDYTDRQHTTTDILGIDTDGDSEIDSFFVDFNYLQRNALLNGNAAAVAASGPVTPRLADLEPDIDGFTVTIQDEFDYGEYKVGIRSTTNDFDTIITVREKTAQVIGDFDQDVRYFISVAAVDELGRESLFSNELTADLLSSVTDLSSQLGVELLQNRPNPFDDRTSISVWVEEAFAYKTAKIEVIKPFGTILYSSDIKLDEGMNEIWYDHQNHHFSQGLLYYRLMIDGKHVQTKAMVHAY